MAYPDEIYSPEKLFDLLSRKEFAQLRSNRKYLAPQRSFLDEAFMREHNLILHPNQQIVRNLLSPETSNTRILVNQGTGAGKTALAIVTAMEHIRLYQQIFTANATRSQAEAPSVYVIGFSRATFLRELLRRPEFGFVNKAELRELQRLREIAERGSQADQEAVHEFESRLRRRLGKRQRGGFFRFYGYKEFFNKLFEISEVENSEGGFLEGLRSGKVRMNLDLIDSMRNSLIICDEIHNAYNSAEINNYGLALRFALNMYEVPERMAAYVKLSPERLERYQSGTLKLIMMTATIINNSPAELVDHLNLLVPTRRIAEVLFSPEAASIRKKLGIPAERLQTIPRLERSDFFLDARNLRPGALELIGQLVQGLVSFLRDTSSRYYPERIIEGETIEIPEALLNTRVHNYRGKELPYLRFIRCKMSELHYQTYQAALSETGALPPDGQALNDLVLPRPPDRVLGLKEERSEELKEGKGKASSRGRERAYKEDEDANEREPLEHERFHEREPLDERSQPEGMPESSATLGGGSQPKPTALPGVFRTRDIKYFYTLQSKAAQAWLDQVGISFTSGDLTGDAFTLGRLEQLSSKYAQMVRDLHANLLQDRGKIFISHQQVHIAGVKLIEEILRRNGLVDENSAPTPETLCSRCGFPMKEHEARPRAKNPKTTDHAYTPARFVTLHGEIEEQTKARSLERFRSSDNLLGYNYRVLIGSRVMNESIDLVACENEWIMHIPDDIPTLLQIFGRVIRKGSHQALPPERRVVHIRIYVTSLPQRRSLSYEEFRYHEKLQDYLVIQEIERVFNQNAADLPLQYSLIFPDPKKAQRDKPQLGTLYYEPSQIHAKTLKFYASPNLTQRVKTSTFNPYYSEEELHRCIYILKRLFAEQGAAFTYAELWELAQNPPFETQFEPHFINEGIFRLALERLVLGVRNNYISRSTTERLSVSRYLDPNDPYIIMRGVDHQVIFSGKLYIAVPVQPTESDRSDTFLGLNQRYLYGSPDTDYDSWYRSEAAYSHRPMRFNITKLLQSSYPNYAQIKYKFFQQYREVPVNQIPTGVEMYDMTFHRQFMEDAISYAFRILTDEKQPFSEMHDFYFKMLYVYDRLELVLFAEHLRDGQLWSLYQKYTTEEVLKVPGLNKGDLKELQEGRKYNPFLMSSILRHDRKFNLDRLAQFLGQRQIQRTAQTRDERLAKFQIRQKRGKIRPVYAHMLPVGHLMDIERGRARPRLLDPETLEFQDHPELSQTYEMPSVENDKLVGYYERMPTSLEVKFKLRPPVQKIERHKDNRMIETGSACATRKKEELIEIMKTLGISQRQEVSIKEMCNAIKVHLMEKDMEELRRVHHLSQAERTKKPRVRWFYLHFERQPNA